MPRKKAAMAPTTPAELEVEYLPIDQITEYPNNSRMHTVEQIELIARSITEYGWTNPILIDANGEVCAGHARLSAARKLAMETVPVIRLGHLTSTQKRALVIADNKIAITGTQWDFPLLKGELAELKLDGFDLVLTGWLPDEIEDLFGRPDSEGEGSGAGSLAAQFGIPPFSVLNAREGWWQERKKSWLALGIKSELGRGENEFTAGPGGGSKTPSPDHGKSGNRRFEPKSPRGGLTWGSSPEITEKGLNYYRKRKANAIPGGQ